MFMASSWTGSWPLGVILTLRRDVFICGETDVIVPWTMVPVTIGWSVSCVSQTGGEIGRGEA